jgi:PhnB protein
MKGANTYLFFDGNCREAMTFYEKALGAELKIVTYAEAPGTPKEARDRIMHASLSSGPVVIMGSDIQPGMPGTFQPGDNFSISINCESLDEIERLFNAMGAGGKTTMPLQDTFWGARFGMLTDKFGVNWMFNYELNKHS